MKLLITGGAGFIGSWIAEFAIKAGHSVSVVDNLSSGDASLLNSQARLYRQDILENMDIVFEREKPDVVIHAAAHVMVRESIKNPAKDATTNILGTINVLEHCRRHKVKKIIYTSTGGARVGNPEYLPVDEKHPINPTSPYGISKHTAEHYVWLYNHLYGLDYLIFCFGNVYGPRDNPRSMRIIPFFLQHILAGRTPTIFGSGEQTRDFIYVEDLAKLIVDCISSSPKHRLFHLAYGTQVSVNQVYSLLQKFTGFKNPANHAPAVEGEVKDIVLDTMLVQKELGWRPETDIESGIRKTAEWFKQHPEALE